MYNQSPVTTNAMNGTPYFVNTAPTPHQQYYQYMQNPHQQQHPQSQPYFITDPKAAAQFQNLQTNINTSPNLYAQQQQQQQPGTGNSASSNNRRNSTAFS